MENRKINIKQIEGGVEMILAGLGINWMNDENFKETPKRVAKAMIEFNRGLYEEFNEIKTFPTKYTGIVFFKNIEAVSLCPHHLLPIEYNVNFAYIPTKYVLGLSKVSRIIKSLCSRPILQEDLTKDIINYFKKKLHPMGLAIVITGTHGCMKYRGIKEATSVKTAELYGAFFTKPQAREEFYQLTK